MGRTRGCIWLAAGVIVALLAGIVAYVTLSRSAVQRQQAVPAAGPSVQVVVATQLIPIGTLLTTDVLAEKQVPVGVAPQGYLSDIAQVEGKISTVELAPNEAVLAQRLADPNVIAGDGRLALVLNEGQVLMAFPASDLMSRVGVLKAGDHVDLLFSLAFPEDRTGEGTASQLATFSGLQNVAIAALVGGQQQEGGAAQPQALLLTVDPQDALMLKYLKDMGAVLDIVLRAPGAEQPFEVDPVDLDFTINKYRIPTGPGR